MINTHKIYRNTKVSRIAQNCGFEFIKVLRHRSKIRLCGISVKNTSARMGSCTWPATKEGGRDLVWVPSVFCPIYSWHPWPLWATILQANQWGSSMNACATEKSVFFILPSRVQVCMRFHFKSPCMWLTHIRMNWNRLVRKWSSRTRHDLFRLFRFNWA